jgi:CBS domain-containing protein
MLLTAMEVAMKAKDVMTRRVQTISADATVIDAARVMLKRHISGLPVVDRAGALVGLLTEGDLLRRAETGTEKRRPRWLEFVLGPGRAAAEFTHAHGRKVSEVMTPSPRSVSEDAPLDDIVSLMERHRIKRVPVVRDGKIVGIVSRANLMQALLDNAKYETAAAASDREIRKPWSKSASKKAWSSSPAQFSMNATVPRSRCLPRMSPACAACVTRWCGSSHSPAW